jgi:hypothetical protein
MSDGMKLVILVPIATTKWPPATIALDQNCQQKESVAVLVIAATISAVLPLPKDFQVLPKSGLA